MQDTFARALGLKARPSARDDIGYLAYNINVIVNFKTRNAEISQ